MRLIRSVRRLNAVLAAAVLVFVGTQCSDNGPVAPDMTIVSVTVDPLTATLRVGETKQLTAVGVTASKTSVSTGVTITSSDNSIVSVSSTGLLRALFPGTATLTAKMGTASASAVITVVPGLPTTITKISGDAQSATVQTAVAVAPSVVVKDSAGNVVPGAVVSFAVQSGGGLISGAAATTNAQGVATLGTWILGSLPGLNTLAVTVLPSNGTVATTFAANATPRPVAPLATIVINAGDAQTATVGTVLPVAPSVLATNTDGLPIANITVTFAVASGGGSIAGATAVTNSLGIATSGLWTLGATVGAQTVTATAEALPPRTFTATATAVPLPATQLVIATAGAGAVVGLPMTTAPSIELRDQNNVLVPSTTALVTATISAGGRLTGTTIVAAVNGVAIFSNLVALDPGTFTLTFSSPGFAPVSSMLRAVSAQPSVALGIATAPSGGTNISPLAVQPVIELRDAANAAAQGTNPVTVAVASGPGALGGTTTINAVNGLAAFSDLALTAGGTYTLVFTSPGLASVTSAPFTVALSPATQLAVTTQPGGSTSGAILTTQPVVELRNVRGDLFPGASNVVTATLTGSGGTLSGTTSVTAVNGVATFTDLKITGTGTFQLVFTSPGLSMAASNSFTTTP